MTHTNKPDTICTEHIVLIEFYKSRSKLYSHAVALASTLPLCETSGDHTVCCIDTVLDFIKNQPKIEELIHIVSKWKGARVLLYGKTYKSNFDLYDFYDRIKANAGKYSVMLHRHNSNTALGSITYEQLPKPFVLYPNLYGAFFAFSDDIGGQIYFCECERKAIENYIRLREQMPLLNYSGDKTYPLGGDFFPPIVASLSKEVTGDPLAQFRFEDKLCFRCNKIVPQLTYCHPMYGGQFMQHYGWYVRQEYFRLGIDPYQIHKANVLPEECTPELYDSILRVSKSPDEYKRIDRTIENSVREQLGYRKVGDSWISETIMFQIIKAIFPEQKILRHYRPKWLCGLELDVYVPDEHIGFEYQGIQHFVAVEHWGGKEQLIKQQEHDARKKELCKENGVVLICINYNESLSSELIISRIKQQQMEEDSFGSSLRLAEK